MTYTVHRYQHAAAIIAALALLQSGLAASVSVNPEADAFVTTGPTGHLSNNNYGGGGALAVAAGALTNGEFQSVIRFNLTAVRDALDAQYGAGQWAIQSVSLQLSSSPHNNPIYNNVSAGLFGISLMANNSWIEGTGNASSPTSDGITYNSLLGTYINNNADQMLGVFDFPGSSEPGAIGAKGCPLERRPLLGQLALELGHAGQHADDHAARRRGGVDPVGGGD